MTEHLCKHHPDGKRWEPGKAIACPHHDVKRRAYNWISDKEARQRDKRAGNIGVDRGGFISGR